MTTTTMTTTTATTTTTDPAPARRGTSRHARPAAGPRHHAPETGRTTLRRLLAGAGAAVLLLASAQVAAGALGFRVVGGGSAKVSAPKPFTAQASTTDPLVPGASIAAEVRVHNPYSRPVVVQAVTPSATVLADGTHPGCDPAAVTFAAPVDPGAPSSTVQPGQTAAVPGAMTMAADAPAACQGAMFRVPVLVTVRLS